MAPNISKEHDTICATPRKVRGPQQRCDLSADGKLGIGSPSFLDTVQRTNALLRGMDEILEHHDAPAHIIRSLDEQVHSYLDTTNGEKVWLQRCKYLLTYPLAKYLKNDLPPAPDMPLNFSGKLRRWLKPRFNAFNRTNTHFWYSWYQCKRCTLPLSESVIEDSYSDHLKALTSADPGDDETIDLIFSDSTFKHVLDQVRGMFTAQVVYGTSFEKRSAKTSASFEYTRKLGGQQNYLRKSVGLDDYNDEDYHYAPPEDQGEEEVNVLYSDELHCMEYRPWVYTKNGSRSNYILDQRAPYGSSEWSDLRRHIKNFDTKRSLSCTIQAVLEPNKVRIISKGEALPYYACRPYQQALLMSIQEFGCFKLTGRPIESEDISILTRMAIPTDKWFSVDYSAATDGLSWKYSGKILRYLIDLLPKKEQELMLQVLGPHRLYYPKGGSGCTEFRGVQQNGQLMGSILSFPILCLANLGVYLLSTQSVQQNWSDDERINHVLINGDDMVYAADPLIWERHVDVGKKVGLKMSIGKAYVHREYLNINSTSFHCPLHSSHRSSDLVPHEVGFLNCGLFFGQHKVQGKTDGGKMKLAKAHLSSDPENGIVVNLNTILKGSRPGREVPLLKKILKTQAATIAAECQTITRQGKKFSRNLFIPEPLGGMGVRCPENFHFKVTKEEVYVAHGYIKEIPTCAYTDQLPLPGYALSEKLEKEVDVPWAVKQGDEVEKPVVPVKRIFLKRIKYLCSHGFIRYVPHRSCCLAPVPSNERDRVVLSQSSEIFNDDFELLPKRVVLENNVCDRFGKEERVMIDGDIRKYHGERSSLYRETDMKCLYPSEFVRSNYESLHNWYLENCIDLPDSICEYWCSVLKKF